MGHTKPENLSDLKSEFDKIKTLGGIKEKSPGVFYWKTVPFLHFHDKDKKRCADVKLANGEWQNLDIDFKANAKTKAAFLKMVSFAYFELIDSHEKNKNKK